MGANVGRTAVSGGHVARLRQTTGSSTRRFRRLLVWWRGAVRIGIGSAECRAALERHCCRRRRRIGTNGRALLVPATGCQRGRAVSGGASRSPIDPVVHAKGWANRMLRAVRVVGRDAASSSSETLCDDDAAAAAANDDDESGQTDGRAAASFTHDREEHVKGSFAWRRARRWAGCRITISTTPPPPPPPPPPPATTNRKKAASANHLCVQTTNYDTSTCH
jgi:hypothetical protein